MTTATVLGTATVLALALLLLGVVCAFVRMIAGPSAADRVVALDMVSMLLVSFAGVAAVAFDDAAFLDVAITLALVTFLATVAFARYIDRGRLRRQAGTDPTAIAETRR